MNERKDLPVFLKSLDFIKWLLTKTEKFPKSSRFTFADRINNLSLDFIEDLIEARYSKSRNEILKNSNLRLEKLRVLLRIAYENRLLSHDAFKFSATSINEIGKMLGGWIKHEKS